MVLMLYHCLRSTPFFRHKSEEIGVESSLEDFVIAVVAVLRILSILLYLATILRRGDLGSWEKDWVDVQQRQKEGVLPRVRQIAASRE